jgi:hypothetical protein
VIGAGPKRLTACVTTLACLLAAGLQASPDPIDECAALLEEYAAEQPESSENVEECVIPVVTPPLNEVCPEQVASLLRDPWSSGLARNSDELVLADLKGLELLRREYAGVKPEAVVNTADVAGVLAGLELSPEETASLWQQFLRWLREWFENEDTDFSGMFEHISFSEATLKMIMYSAIGLIILLAILVVGGELRLALRNRRSTETFGWRERKAEHSPPLDFDQLARAPLREQPGLLLKIIMAQLQATGILRLRSSCTHRDITSAAAALDLGDGLGTISNAAERATFGDWCPAEEDMAALLETGQGVCLAIEVRT